MHTTNLSNVRTCCSEMLDHSISRHLRHSQTWLFGCEIGRLLLIRALRANKRRPWSMCPSDDLAIREQIRCWTPAISSIWWFGSGKGTHSATMGVAPSTRISQSNWAPVEGGLVLSPLKSLRTVFILRRTWLITKSELEEQQLAGSTRQRPLLGPHTVFDAQFRELCLSLQHDLTRFLRFCWC
jgi:hypothetical protein